WQSGAWLGAEHHAVPSAHRVSDVMRGVELHPQANAPGVDCAPRLHADRTGGGERAARLCARLSSRRRVGEIMNFHRRAQQRAAVGRPVRVGLIGAGKFGSMFLAQVPRMTGIEVMVIADLDPERARAACRTVGWDLWQVAKTVLLASGADACA